MSRLIARRRVGAAIILVLLAIVTTETVALAATLVRQGTVQYMKVAATADYVETYSTTWTDVPGTALAMPVPSGEHDFFQVTFSARTGCGRVNTFASYADCNVRALVDGQQAAPGQVAFANASVPTYAPITMQWLSSNVLAPGTHYVKVQFSVSADWNQMWFTSRTFTVVRVKAF